VTLVIAKSSNLQKIPFNINGISILGYEVDGPEQIETNRKKIRDILLNGLDKQALDSIVHDALPDLSIERKSKVIDSREEKLYKIAVAPDKEIGYITGNIKYINNVDVWVNSENTNMQMARHYERSISATIRYEGAIRDDNGYVIDDVIAKDLKKVTKGRDCTPANIIVTTAGALEENNKVKRIFHAAAVIGEPGKGYSPIRNVEDCVRNALAKADSKALAEVDIQSILFPLIGTGTSRATAQETANKLIDAAVCYFEDNRNSRIKRVYFLVYNEQDRDICRHKFITDPKISTPGETLPS
jgi:O-acetyl-ADP-ribose deacetylase (regulator of RNase III)